MLTLDNKESVELYENYIHSNLSLKEYLDIVEIKLGLHRTTAQRIIKSIDSSRRCKDVQKTNAS